MNLLTIVNKYLPKSKKRIVFYSNLGFRDNVKSLFDYLVRHEYHKKYKIVCVSNNFYGAEKIPGVKYTNLYVGLFYFLISKYFFYSFGKYPIKPSEKQVVVNLWHGMPLKRIGNLEEHLVEKDFNFFTYLVSSSDFFTPTMKKAFRASENQILKVGNMRNDELFTYDKRNYIIWLPTYRDSQEGEELLFSLTNIDFAKLNGQLAEVDMELFIKLHPLEKRTLPLLSVFKRIHILTDQDLSDRKISLYEFLGQTAGLITDYSSVFVDYYLLHRPVAFTLDDIETYKMDRGFIIEDIEELMIGHRILSLNDLIDFIVDTNSEKDRFYDQRLEVNNQLNEIQNEFRKSLINMINLE